MRAAEISSRGCAQTNGGPIDQEVRDFVARLPNRCLQKPFDPLSVVEEALTVT